MKRARGSSLTYYNNAKKALALVHRVDEVKDIRDKAEAMQVYARQAKDGVLIAHATEIRMRAEIRAGEILAEMARAGERAKSKDTLARGRTQQPRAAPKLSDLGVNKTQSSRWQKLAAMPPEKQEQTIRRRVQIAVAAAEDDKAVVSAARAERHENKRKQREDREQALAGKILALPQKKYGVVYADPEWRWEAWSEKGLDSASADNHYPTSVATVIAERDVASIAAEDSVLFLWATAPMIEAALSVMRARGFAYKSQAVWDKEIPGTGYWFRNQHEILLVGTRGNVPAPAEGTQWSSVLRERRTQHSVKPNCAYEMIESYFPNVPQIELNARKARKGWDQWGNEAPLDEAAE
jgi:N6-adenosine-specific RNA methylase IME4